MAEVQFVRFVKPAPGRLVSRWDALASGAFIGARRTTPEEQAAGKPVIEWDEKHVLPLTREFCDRFVRELGRALRNGDLREVQRKDWEAWLKLEQEREDAKTKAVEEAAAKAKAEADEQAKTAAPAEPATSKGKGK